MIFTDYEIFPKILIDYSKLSHLDTHIYIPGNLSVLLFCMTERCDQQQWQ